MYHLVNMGHNSMAEHLTRSDCERAQAVDRTDDGMLWNNSEDNGDVSWVRGR
jgi:hypothetical protein